MRFFSSIADVLPFSTYDIIWITSYFVNTHFAMRRKRRFPIPCVPAGCGQRGPFSHVREWPPLDPPREREGSPPQPPTLVVSILKNCSACGIGCSVHGFAMNPCVSLHVATAPYYREARVTFAWRRTACGMRHCFARRIDETGGKRKLVSTPTRSAERQRIIEAEANRIVKPMAASVSNAATQALSLRRYESCSSSRLPIKAFLLGVKGGYSLSEEREYPP